jgi:hypothetical protein
VLYIILVDMRTSPHSGKIVAISHNEEIATFKTAEEAKALMKEHCLKVFPHEIIGLDFEGHVETVLFANP